MVWGCVPVAVTSDVSPWQPMFPVWPSSGDLDLELNPSSLRFSAETSFASEQDFSGQVFTPFMHETSKTAIFMTFYF